MAQPEEPRVENELFEHPLPEGYRDELKELMSADLPASPRGSGSLLVFQLGPMRLALPTRIAAAVAPPLHIARVPHRSGTVLLGLVAFRGEILPCCSLTRLLDVPQAQAAYGRTLILQESPTRRWAVPIDAVIGIRTGGGEPANEPAPLPSPWVQASYAADGGAYHLLDNETLFRQVNLATA